MVDAFNRRGALRNGDGASDPRRRYFAMLPYGMVKFHGAPAEVRDLPIGDPLARTVAATTERRGGNDPSHPRRISSSAILMPGTTMPFYLKMMLASIPDRVGRGKCLASSKEVALPPA